MRHIALIAGVVFAVAALTIGINRIVVTDGQVVAFKSDYLPLER